MTIATASDDPLYDVSVEAMPRFLGAALTYDARTVLDWHDHEVGQLVHAMSGTMRLATADHVVLLPPSMALWVPPGIRHRIEFMARAEMRTIYVRPDILPIEGPRCRILDVSPLLRELILAAIPPALPDTDTPRRIALFDLLAAELAESTEIPLSLPMPLDKRIRPMADRALVNPGDIGSISAWAATAPASRKTVERLFLRQTGMTPSHWLKQARLIFAVSALAEGQSVSSVALDLGYATPSSFAYMFRQTLGVAPSKFSRRRPPPTSL